MPPESWASNDGVARSMQSNKRRDTSLELRTRKELHRRGYRFRVDFAPGESKRMRADIVFTRKRVAVFLDGCFWHGCPSHYTAPIRNAAFWENKVVVNRRRDAATTKSLEYQGWTVLRYWEHQPLEEVVADIISALT